MEDVSEFGIKKENHMSDSKTAFSSKYSIMQIPEAKSARRSYMLTDVSSTSKSSEKRNYSVHNSYLDLIWTTYVPGQP